MSIRSCLTRRAHMILERERTKGWDDAKSSKVSQFHFHVREREGATLEVTKPPRSSPRLPLYTGDLTSHGECSVMRTLFTTDSWQAPQMAAASDGSLLTCLLISACALSGITTGLLLVNVRMGTLWMLVQAT